MSVPLEQIFTECYRELRPRAPIPPFRISFFRFANVNNTIRLREGLALVRISDLLEAAPEPVLRSIAHILLAKLYRKPIEPGYATRYRRYVSSYEMTQRTHLVRQLRGRKQLNSPRGHVWNLEEIFDELNLRFFFGLMGRPQMSWSREVSRHLLGHYDPAHNTIIVSRIFDNPKLPRFLVEYIVYHEMLHLKHPVKLRGSRRCVHPRAFQEDEKLFPQLEEVKVWLKRL
ncbi:MAG TPA: hypothetical protein VKB56_12985 [Terriglobales bacterium]|nr:hypothetical protein [Terriglobales bacterium]